MITNKIKANKSLAQVAKEFAIARDFGWKPKLLENGEFVAFRPDSSTEFGRQFYAEWGTLFPFGKENWCELWCQFNRWIETDKNSVHGGETLPDDGVAVLVVKDQEGGRFAVVCQQWIRNPGWWDWVWHPVAIITD